MNSDLLLPARQDFGPVQRHVKVAAFLQVNEFDHFEHFSQMLVRHALVLHLESRVRVDDLVSQSAQGEIRLLRNVEQFRAGWLDQTTSEQWPQFAQQTEQRRLAASVRSAD